MYDTGIFINDFATHDSSRDLVLAGTQQATEVKFLLDRQDAKAEIIEQSVEKVKYLKEMHHELQYAFVPPVTAAHLAAGADPIHECRSFDPVSILFVHLVGLTDLCASASPSVTIPWLDAVFTALDEIAGVHGVFKVDTVGAGHLLISGAPQASDHHAEHCVDYALHALEKVKGMKAPDGTGLKVELRCGIHTGRVIAGVIGEKLAKFCLFGEAVRVAHAAQETCEPNRVKITSVTETALKKLDVKNMYQVSKAAAPMVIDEDEDDGKKWDMYYVDGKNGPYRLLLANEEESASRGVTPLSPVALSR